MAQSTKIPSKLMDHKFATTAGEKTLTELIEGDRPTVFISYPMDFTSVCTKQLCSYRDNWSQLSSLNCRWWGINRASASKHDKFKSQYELPMELVTDPKAELLGALGLNGILSAKRGFTAVSPEGEILGSTSIFPVRYQKTEDVIAFLQPLL